jgi:GntR family transcriptional repressor for pyruvate dehydrogenase complex
VGIEMSVKTLASTKVLLELTQSIENGVWKPGQKLPSLAALAVELLVSVSTLREAIRIMEDKGYILIEHGRGMFVRSQNHWRVSKPFQLDSFPVENMFSLLELRGLLEPVMAGLAAERGSPGQIQAIKESAAKMIDNLAKEEDYFEADISFHDHVAEACSNEVMAEVMKGISDLLLESRRNTNRIPGSSQRAAHFHMLIALAIEQRNATLAKEMMHAHLEDVRRDFMKLKEESKIIVDNEEK